MGWGSAKMLQPNLAENTKKYFFSGQAFGRAKTRGSRTANYAKKKLNFQGTLMVGGSASGDFLACPIFQASTLDLLLGGTVSHALITMVCLQICY